MLAETLEDKVTYFYTKELALNSITIQFKKENNLIF